MRSSPACTWWWTLRIIGGRSGRILATMGKAMMGKAAVEKAAVEKAAVEWEWEEEE